MLLPFAGRTVFLAAALLLQSGPQIPPPRGLLNDFANAISPVSAARIERIAQDVRDKSGGEIAVVTLADLGGREPGEIALRIAREWKVGAQAAVGDQRRNAGVVVLLVPKETAADGRGRCRIEVGQGSEGFITDATSGDICREATPFFAQRDYGTGLELVTLRVAQRFAQEFQFTLDTASQFRAPSREPAQRRGRGGGINPLFLLLLLFFVLSALGGGRRRGCMPIFIPFGGFGGGGGGGGWGGGGFGGGGGGGFGGFGGGGGFSGGGGGSDW